jgi:hypothetical protein
MSLIPVARFCLSGLIDFDVFFLGIFSSPFSFHLAFAAKRLIPYMQHAHIVF